jgi:hypothetical protein
MTTRLRILLPALVVAALLVGCKKTPAPTNEVVAFRVATLPASPTDDSWKQVPEHVAKLILQDLVEPRLMKPSTPEVRVQAVTNGSEIVFRLRWADAEQNDLPGSGRFTDACAVQIPSKLEPQPPAPQMGETGRPVEVTFWRADWQAYVNGRGDSIRDLYPNASIDHYPFEAASLPPGSTEQKEMATRYAPAQALANRRSGPRQSPVESLVAEGPGTLSPAPANGVHGQGVRTENGWAVLIGRRLPEGLAPRARTQIAFAVWNGSQQETGSRKMRTGWIPLAIREAP